MPPPPAPRPSPRLGTHRLHFCRCRFVRLGHFASTGSYSVRPFVPGFPHSASCLRGSPAGWRASAGFAPGMVGVSAPSLLTAESQPLRAEGIRVLSRSRRSRCRALGSEPCLSECDQRSRFSGPAVTGVSSPGSTKLVFSFVPGVRGAGLSQLPHRVLLPAATQGPSVPLHAVTSSALLGPPSGLIRGVPDEFCLENRLDLGRDSPLRRKVSAPRGPRLGSGASGWG